MLLKRVIKRTPDQKKIAVAIMNISVDHSGYEGCFLSDKRFPKSRRNWS
jgi:hypothetical protein